MLNNCNSTTKRQEKTKKKKTKPWKQEIKTYTT